MTSPCSDVICSTTLPVLPVVAARSLSGPSMLRVTLSGWVTSSVIQRGSSVSSS